MQKSLFAWRCATHKAFCKVGYSCRRGKQLNYRHNSDLIEQIPISEDLLVLLTRDKDVDSTSSITNYKKLIKKAIGPELRDRFICKPGKKTELETAVTKKFMGNFKYTDYILDWIKGSKTGKGLPSYKELSSNPIILPHDPNDQLKRIFILIGSLKAGNNDSGILKELSALLDTLLKEEVITKQLYKTLFYKAKSYYELNANK